MSNKLMKLLFRFSFRIIVNIVGLLAAAYFLPGFILRTNALQILLIALVLTILNYTLKPLLKLFLGPIIVLTFGLGLIAINAIIIYLLEIIFPTLTIENLPTLIYASLIISFINFVFHFVEK